MGGCVSKSPQKVVPYSDGENLATAENTNSKNAFHGPPTEQAEERRNEGKKDESPFGSEEKSKEVEIQVSNSRSRGATKFFTKASVGHVQNGMPKVKEELPKLIKACTFRANTILKAPVAFDVGFDDDKCMTTQRKFPRRLKKLDGAPGLTAELLWQKQEIAEKNRLKELEKKTETTSKHQRDLLQAREFERTRNAQIQMNTKLLATEKTHQSYIEGIVSKQKSREQKAKRVRAKALRLDEKEEDLIHVDETYISDSDSEDACWHDDDFRRSTSGDQEVECAQKINDADTNSIDEFFETGPQVQSNEIYAL